MALIKDSEDFASAYPALKSVEWGMLLPSVELVEYSELRQQVLGPTLYDALHAAYQLSIAVSPTAMSSALANLHAKVRKPLAHLAAARAIPKLNVLFTSTGAMIAETEKMKAAPMWRTRDAEKQALKDGYGFLDMLIEFLNTNSSTYTTWTAAPVYTEVRESLVPTMTEANRHLRLSGPWMLHKLRPAMRSIQEGPVKTLLGDTAYDALLAAVVANNPSADQVKQLDQIRPALLHGAIASEILPLGIGIDSTGVWNWQGSTSGGQASGGEQPANEKRTDALIRHHQTKSNAHLASLKALVTPAEPDAGFPGHQAGGIYFGG